MGPLPSELVLPLHLAESQFLQVLLSDFSLKRDGRGMRLDVRFDDATPAIRVWQAKRHLRAAMPNFDAKASRYQQELDAFLIHNQGSAYEFHDAGFWFRYASGGTLPILRLGSEQGPSLEYYCLFYRDIDPVGWNIANGGCDSRDELWNPAEAIDRELREELLILDLKNKRRYVFAADAGKPLERPEFAVARRFWREMFPQLDLPAFQELEVPVKWFGGPDSLTVQIGDDAPKTVAGCFLNINAEDFGIEIDRVAKIHVPEDVVLCDGEIVGASLINRPVALFEVERFNREFAAGAVEFFPDRFYYNAGRQNVADLKRVIGDLSRGRNRSPTEKETDQFLAAEPKYGLCPVTRRIIQRFLALYPPQQPGAPGRFEVFISFAHEDRSLAGLVHQLLRDRRRVFFYDSSNRDSNFSRAIDDALDQARCLIVVASKPDHVRKGWVEYEWRSFHNDLCTRGDAGSQLLSFLASGFDPADLPRPLRSRLYVVCDPHRPEPGLQQLAHLVL